MEENFSRRKLLEPIELKLLNEKSDFYGFSQIFTHLGSIFIISYFHFTFMNTWWVIITGLFLGIFINFLYAAQHELSHGTVFRTSWLNVFFGRAIGFVMLFPRDYDQLMHFAHHRWTQDWEKDGELVRKPYTLKSYLTYFLGFSYWYDKITGILRRAKGVVVEPYIRKSEYRKITIESRFHVLGYFVILIASIYFQTWFALTFWIIPMLLTKPFQQLQNTIEHLGLPHRKDILSNTRSTRTNFFMRWLCWQMPYHTAHHTFPSVPFWKLKKLNDKIESNAGKVHSMGYIEFQIEVIKSLWSKDESKWPMNEVWITSSHDGVSRKIPIE